MRSGGRIIFAALAVLPLVACGMFDGRDELRRPLHAGAAPDDLPPAPMDPAVPVSDERTLIGAPYSIDGQSYTPAATTRYDEIGYAAILWDTADGRRTANGEAYVPTAIAAAHRTLPLPSYVEVTAIETGKTIVVRVNDRGPMLNDRIIALTPAAARQLGLAMDGTGGVRVRLVNPLEQERTVLRAGGQVPERLELPQNLRGAMARRLPPAPAPLTGPVRTATAPAGPVRVPAPAPSLVPALAAASPVPVPDPVPDPVPAAVAGSTTPRPSPPPPAAPLVARADVPPATILAPTTRPPAPVPPSPLPSASALVPPPEPAAAPVPDVAADQGRYVVQIAALSSRTRAEALARRVEGYVMPIGSLFRVRTGPYPTQAAARAALGQIHAKGYAGARVMTNDAR